MLKRLSLLFLAGALLATGADVINTARPRFLTSAQITNIHNHVTGTGGTCNGGTKGDQVWCDFATKVQSLYGIGQGSNRNGSTYLDGDMFMYVALHDIPGDATDGAAYDPGGHTSAQWATETINAGYAYLENCAVTSFCGAVKMTPVSTGVQTGWYVGGLSATGTVGQTCHLTFTNGGASGATADVALTGTNTISATPSFAITAASWSNGIATVTIGPYAPFLTGAVTISGMTPSAWNCSSGTGCTVTAVTSTTISYATLKSSNPGTATVFGTATPLRNYLNITASGSVTSAPTSASTSNGTATGCTGTVTVATQNYGCLNNSFANCSYTYPLLGGNDVANQGYHYALINDLLNAYSDYSPLTTQNETDFFHATDWTLQFAMANLNPVNGTDVQNYCTGWSWNVNNLSSAPGAYQGPNDNECLGYLSTIAEEAVGIYGLGINPGDDKNRNGGTQVGTNQQLDYLMNDTTHPQPYQCCGLRSDWEYWYSNTYGVGGIQAEGPEYGGDDYQYDSTMLTALVNGTNIPVSEFSTYLNSTAKWLLYDTTQFGDFLSANPPGPNFYQMQFSDEQIASANWRPSSGTIKAALTYAYLLYQLDNTNVYAQYLRYWLNNFGTLNSGATLDSYIWRLAFKDFPVSTSTNYTLTLPKNYTSNSTCPTGGSAVGNCSYNMSISMSNWGSSGCTVWQKFSSIYVRHGHDDPGSVNMACNGQWLLTDMPGYASATNAEAQWTGGVHNVLLQQAPADNGGWKAGLNPKADGDPVQVYYENPSNDAYVYTYGILTQAYRSSHMTPGSFGSFLNPTFVGRKTLYLKPNRIVMMDNGTYNAATKVQQNWVTLSASTDAAPTTTGGQIKSLNSTQQVIIRPIYPSSGLTLASLRTDADTVFSTNCSTGGGVGCLVLNSAAAITNAAGVGKTLYTNKIQNLTGATSQLVMSFIEAGTAGATLTPPSLLTAGNALCTDIGDVTQEQIGCFSNSASGGTISLPFTYTVGGSATNSLHVITDLTPGLSVGVSVATHAFTISSGGAFNVSSQGVLAFTWNGTTATQINTGSSPTCSITTSSLPDGALGVAYNQTISTANCTSPTFGVIAGALPGWASLNTGTGAITGTPNAAGTTFFTIGVSDASCTTNNVFPCSSALSIGVTSGCAFAVGPTFSSGTQGTAYAFTVTTTGCVLPETMTVTAGALPPGLTLGFNSGLNKWQITGIPTAASPTPYLFNLHDLDNVGGTADLSNASILIGQTAPQPGEAAVNGTFSGVK